MLRLVSGKPFFEMCCFHIWALPERGGGVKACQDGLEHFFPPHLPGVVKACQDGLEHFFSIFARLTEGVGSLKLFGQGPIEPTHFKKGLP